MQDFKQHSHSFVLYMCLQCVSRITSNIDVVGDMIPSALLSSSIALTCSANLTDFWHVGGSRSSCWSSVLSLPRMVHLDDDLISFSKMCFRCLNAVPVFGFFDLF